MTITVHRPSGGTACPVGIQYRQREDEPNVMAYGRCGTIESRATYRGARWAFVARFATADEARAALLQIGKGTEEQSANVK